MDTIHDRLTTMRTEALSLLDDVVGRPDLTGREHASMISELQELTNRLGTLEQITSPAAVAPAPILLR